MGAYQYSLAASLVVNSISALAGTLQLRYGGFIQEAVSNNRGFIVLFLFLITNLAITIIIETPVLVLLNRDDRNLSIKASIRMNLISSSDKCKELIDLSISEATSAIERHSKAQ